MTPQERSISAQCFGLNSCTVDADHYSEDGQQLVAQDRVGAGRPLLDAADMQGRGGEIDLGPAQVDQLGYPEEPG
jgi:hypothetical protein